MSTTHQFMSLTLTVRFRNVQCPTMKITSLVEVLYMSVHASCKVLFLSSAASFNITVSAFSYSYL